MKTRRIAHRDIKPENIMLDESQHPKLGDFGTAKGIGKDSKCEKKCLTFVGTAE